MSPNVRRSTIAGNAVRWLAFTIACGACGPAASQTRTELAPLSAPSESSASREGGNNPTEAELYTDRARFFEDVRAERAALEAACRADPRACVDFAQSLITHALHAPSESMRAADAYGAACEADDITACRSGAHILLDRGRTPETAARAARYLDRGCTNRDPELCYTAGVERLPNGRLRTDGELAFTQLRTACRLGYFRACTSLLTASGSGLVAPIPAADVDTFFATGRSDSQARPSARVSALQRRCGYRAQSAFYAPIVAALDARSAAVPLSRPGVVLAQDLPQNVREAMSCTLEGAYGDVSLGHQPRLRYVRALAPLSGGGYDVFVEWFEIEDDVPVLYATRAHVTANVFRVVANEAFPIETERVSFDLLSHESRLDVDGDGLRDMLVVYGWATDEEIFEELVIAASRGGELSRMPIPHTGRATVEGCFLPSSSVPMLLTLRSERHPAHEIGWSESCVGLFSFPTFEDPSLIPARFEVGPRLLAPDGLPVLPQGGTHVVRSFESRSSTDTRLSVVERPGSRGLDDPRGFAFDSGEFPFAMCPEHPVFLLHGMEDNEPVSQVMQSVALVNVGGTLGPVLPASEPISGCEVNDE